MVERVSKMANLSAATTAFVMKRLRTLLMALAGGKMPRLYPIAVKAVLGRQKRRGEHLPTAERKVLRENGWKLQGTLERYLGPNARSGAMRDQTFKYLVEYMNRYSRGLGRALVDARKEAEEREEWERFTDLPKWYELPTEAELHELDAPPWIATYFVEPHSRSRVARAFLLDAMRAGIPSSVVAEAWRRILAPFYGHARSGGVLLRWDELKESALRRALRASIEAERIWLGLDGATRVKPNPLSARLPNPLRNGPGLLGTLEDAPR